MKSDMNMQVEFDKLHLLLRSSLMKKIVSEVALALEQGEVLFSMPNILETKTVIEIYADRYEVQKELSTGDVLIEGYESVLNALRKTSADSISIISIAAPTATYIVFLSTSADILYGIIKSEASNFKKALELHKLYKIRGLHSSSGIFSKMILTPFTSPRN